MGRLACQLTRSALLLSCAEAPRRALTSQAILFVDDLPDGLQSQMVDPQTARARIRAHLIIPSFCSTSSAVTSGSSCAGCCRSIGAPQAGSASTEEA